jgi:long-chain acyl-CoA synthetase
LRLLDLVRAGVRKHADKPFLISEGRSLTYSGLAASTAGLSAQLRQAGLGPHGVAGILVDDPLLHVTSVLACSALGSVAVPLHAETPAPRLAAILADCSATLVVTDQTGVEAGLSGCRVFRLPAWGDLLEGPAVELPPGASGDQVLTYYATSGSTGKPRYVATTVGAHARAAGAIAESATLTGEDVCLSALPLAHSYGLGGIVWPALAVGATLVILKRFTPRGFLNLARERRVTVVFAVPTMLDLILHAETENTPRLGLPDIRAIYWGSAPCSRKTIQDFHDRFGIFLGPNYGSAEAWGLTVALEDDLETCLDTVGYAQVGVRIWAADPLTGTRLPDGQVGEIVATGPGVGLGYLGDPEATAEVFRANGCHTGDMGFIDSRGRLRLVGRKKRIIKRGGYSVAPEEIEQTLLALDGLTEAYVTGRAGPTGADVLVALVGVTRPLTSQEVLDHLSSRLEPFKVPQIVLFADRLPRNANHKVDVPRAEALIDELLSSR